jgi:hypothetical protein
MLELKEIMYNWVRSEEQLADALTKDGASTKLLLEVLRSAKV